MSESSLLKNPVFWVSIATITTGLFKYVISYMLKSKCSDFNMCWGMIKIKRDISIERDIEIAQIQNNIHTDESDINDGITVTPPQPPRRIQQ